MGALLRAAHGAGLACETHTFADMQHGWVPRGDASDPNVARDVADALARAVAFFEAHLLAPTRFDAVHRHQDRMDKVVRARLDAKRAQSKADVEALFERISRERRLPFGFGCVAIRDESFEVFPSFPVMHRKHLEVFGDELFPRELRNQHGDPASPIPQNVINKPPSAELKPDQRDDDDLPPYDLLDQVLEAYVEDDRSYEEMLGMGFEASVVERVMRSVDRNEFKRRQGAVGIKITPRAFGRDRRMPIVNRYQGHGS